ncbi:MAG: hypothetical protein ABI600_13910 [Luteolibacter sp.]
MYKLIPVSRAIAERLRTAEISFARWMFSTAPVSKQLKLSSPVLQRPPHRGVEMV